MVRKTANSAAAAAAAAAPAAAAPAKASERNPLTSDFEFSGPYIGPVGVLVGLPLLVWASSYFCKDYAGWVTIPTSLPSLAEVVERSFSLEACAVYLTWFFYQVLLHWLVPGKDIPGVEMRDGGRLLYRINGFRCLLVTAATCAAVHIYKPWGYDLFWLPKNLLPFATASILFSFALSVYLYASSFVGDKLLAEGGNSKIALYDFFIGRELNPRVTLPGGFSLDLKYFCELRPGLFLWVLLVASAALKQYEDQGAVSAGMLIVLVLQALYVADSVFCEECILSTMDIIQDGFGFMLAFGDLAWVPFMYSFQARFLLDAGASSGGAALGGLAAAQVWEVPGLGLQVAFDKSPLFYAACLAVGVGGFYIFRSANAQKDLFKSEPNHPKVKAWRTIKREDGKALLADGWWGFARHVNYTGDWMLSIGMSLPTGFATPVTYFYPIYFAVLLIHREMRDEHKCARKYGADWLKYKAAVPYRFIKYVW